MICLTRYVSWLDRDPGLHLAHLNLRPKLIHYCKNSQLPSSNCCAESRQFRERWGFSSFTILRKSLLKGSWPALSTLQMLGSKLPRTSFEAFGLISGAMSRLSQTCRPRHYSSARIDQAIPVDRVWVILGWDVSSTATSPHCQIQSIITPEYLGETCLRAHVRQSVCP